ncbi:MAG: mechanosensitive ion channel family protein [Armatimonadetes bacterium]|nr:mechanosensitive ion channel family protein [Armatimonadota bacterium]
MPTELQLFLTNAIGWLRFWLLPKLWSAIIIAFFAYLLIRWLDGRWHSWLRPALTSTNKNRSASQSVWRQVRILALPRAITRIAVIALAGWMILEGFGAPREIILWGLTIIVVSVLWAIRHLLSDLTAGYSLIFDDTLAEGDQISSSFGEGVVERISWFAVYLRTKDGTQIVIPHKALMSNVFKIHRSPSTTRTIQ